MPPAPAAGSRSSKRAPRPTVSAPATKATSSRRAPALKPLSRSRDVVNTNLGAHSRTDPIGALNTLLRLVSSISTRIGGCQYKMTSSEHALSLHLLSIVEPYVYQGARALAAAANPSCKASGTPLVGLIYQPTEILDAIMSHIDSKRDLLQVGLCCKRLHDVVFPRHFDYRVVRCKVSSISVWNHLAVHRSLAANIRKLEILDERSKISTPSRLSTSDLPRTIGQRDTDFDSTDDEVKAKGIHGKQERYLVNALKKMTGLKEIKWSCNHSPIPLERVWPIVAQTCGLTLQKMDTCNNLIFSASSDDESESSSDDADEAGTSVTQPAVGTRTLRCVLD